MKMNRREAFRYLGFHNAEPDAQTQSILEACLPALTQAASFKHALLRLPVMAEGETILISVLHIQSRALLRHLEGCNEAFLFAATLGAGVDRLMQMYSKTDMPSAVVLQACAAALLESHCDAVQERLAQELQEKGLYLRPRFSPGYGDFSLQHQPDLLRILDAPKKIGLSCTQSNMLTPTKSITAIIGISAQRERCHIHRCDACDKADCAFKKE